MTKPSGVVGLIVSDRGHVFCEASDFDSSKPGGFGLLDSQRRRMKTLLGKRLVWNLASPYLAAFFEDEYDRRDLIDKIIRNPEKYKMTYIESVVGHDE